MLFESLSDIDEPQIGELLRNRYEDAKSLVDFLLELSDGDDFETQKMEFLKIKTPR